MNRKPSSPFAANPGRYRNVPKRVKNPKTKSGCYIVVAPVVALFAVAAMWLA